MVEEEEEDVTGIASPVWITLRQLGARMAGSSVLKTCAGKLQEHISMQAHTVATGGGGGRGNEAEGAILGVVAGVLVEEEEEEGEGFESERKSGGSEEEEEAGQATCKVCEDVCDSGIEVVVVAANVPVLTGAVAMVTVAAVEAVAVEAVAVEAVAAVEVVAVEVVVVAVVSTGICSSQNRNPLPALHTPACTERFASRFFEKVSGRVPRDTYSHL